MGVATLIIGIGGQGGKIVSKIASRTGMEHATNVEFVALDTDVNDLDKLHRANPRIATVQTSYRATVGAALDANKEACDGWFPVTPGLLGKSLTEGAGQVRAISRLAFDHAVENGKMRPLEKTIERLRALKGDPYEQSLRIMICGSLVGGTGSGIALPLAMYIRNFLRTRYQDQSSIIRGFFLDPDCLFGVITDEEERKNLRCNAYAVIREIDAFMRKQYMQDAEKGYRHVVFNAPQPGSGRRMDYPNLLPYNYVFLMDAMNLDGEHLPELGDYIDHMADIIFTQSIGTASSRLNSTEDNFTRRLDQSKGRARYCGAGCSHLVYPYETIRHYFGLKWSSASITNEWLEIDHAFQRELRDGVVDDTTVDRAKSYVATFDQLRGQSRLYAKIGKDSKIHERVRAQGNAMVDRESPIGKAYVKSLKSFATSWNGNGLALACGPLDAFLAYERDSDEPPTEPEDVKSFAREGGSGWISAFESLCTDYGVANERYYHLVASDVTDTVKTYATRLFRTPDSDMNPLEMLRDGQFIESYLSKQNGAGAKHPLVVRYILNDALVELTEELEGLKAQRDGLKNALYDTYDSLDDDSSEEGIRREEPKGFAAITAFINNMQNRSEASDAQAAEGASIGVTLTDAREEINRFRQLVVQCEILEAARQHIESLSLAYQGFFNYMEGRIPFLEDEAAAIEEDPAFNARVGSPTLYVCASKPCLQGMYAACPQAGSSAELPIELCADIYRGVVRYAALNRSGMGQAERIEAGDIAFANLFKRTVLDFWTMRLEDPALGYKSEVKKPVLRAIIDEAAYLKPSHIVEPEEVEAYVRGHLLDTIEQAYDLAEPYIMKPIELPNEKPSNFVACIYAKGVTDGLGKYARDAAERLKAYNGNEIEGGEVSEQELLFSRQIYGFRASNLPHYSSAHYGKEARPAGEYHEAYWEVARTLSPDTSRNQYITPHIDRHWHLINYLPDISDEHQSELYGDIIEAFLFGLSYKQFGSRTASDGASVFHLKTGYGQRQVELMTANGGRCDKYHEVFDALQLDPQVVYELINRSRESLASERGALSSPSVEFSQLVRNVHSNAFGKYPGAEHVILAIDAFKNDVAALSGEKSLKEQERAQFLAEQVGSFFEPNPGASLELRRIRHSIFEVPVYYRISLPPNDLRAGEIEDMLDGIYASTRRYFAAFTSDEALDTTCSRFFEEQYLLFELNLPKIEASFPGMAWSDVVNVVREKVLSLFNRFTTEGQALADAQDQFQLRWAGVREAKNNLLRQQRYEASPDADAQ